jgi:hypothetical protein
MALHPSTFEDLKPTPDQIEQMAKLRSATAEYATRLELDLPDGPDKTFILRQVRATAMWINVAITRYADGTPRSELPEWDSKAPDADK